MDFTNIDWLKKNHQMVHYFGLGFIQLKLSPTTRMHFYTSKLLPIISLEDMHNHRYDFTSNILKGNLIHSTFEIVEGNTHIIELESCKEGVVCETKGKECGVRLSGVQSYSVGSWYTIPHYVFHTVASDFCITIITRTDYKKELAEVVRPINSNKVCPFSKKVEENELWEIINYMLRSE